MFSHGVRISSLPNILIRRSVSNVRSGLGRRTFLPRVFKDDRSLSFGVLGFTFRFVLRRGLLDEFVLDDLGFERELGFGFLEISVFGCDFL